MTKQSDDIAGSMVADQAKPIWTPSSSRINASYMQKFLNDVSARGKIPIKDWDHLYRWSIAQTDDFWSALSDFVGIKWQKSPKAAWTAGPSMRESHWFAGAKLNFAENLLPAPNNQVVMVAIAEGATRKTWTGLELWNDVARCAVALRKNGVRPNDRVAGVLVNGPEAVISMLATSAVGAIWSSCSPDFGTRGIADRLTQISPKIIFATSSYTYAGKLNTNLKQTIEAVQSLPDKPTVIAVDHMHRGQDQFADFCAEGGGPSDVALPLAFEPRRFHDPQYIMFSSGTTGLPKCITHGVGGTLLQHKKELMLHSDIGPGDCLFYFTTCGWMMWNWMVSAIACGAKIVTFDGAPTYPSVARLWDVCRDEGVTHFGTSPKFISVCGQQEGFNPADNGAISKLRTILSTGSPLLPAHFQWIYEKFPDVHLASISGGTDIIGCFMLGNPIRPVYLGEIQGPGLGMAIEGWDESQRSVTGEKSELVCVKPFVSMPVGFWNDQNGERYRKAYFDFYENKDVWRHGDFVEITEHGGIIVYGRSDATLNPGGVRIGTAEIYRAVESLAFISDSLAIGQEQKDDTRVLLFVKLAPGYVWSEDLAKQVKTRIRSELTPRHVPALVIAVKDIPYTRSGKKVEMAVTKVIHGQDVSNKDALVNPEALSEYEALRDRLG